ncbi:Dynein 8 kDa light chain, flagellar outer arm, partial [Ananas comosus]
TSGLGKEIGRGAAMAEGAAASVARLRVSDNNRKKPAAKITLKSADMAEEMREEVFCCARAAFDGHAMEKDIAEYIKKEFDRNHGPTWHCIVGRNFGTGIYRFPLLFCFTSVRRTNILSAFIYPCETGSFVTHETNHFIYFYIESKAVLLFKSG